MQLFTRGVLFLLQLLLWVTLLKYGYCAVLSSPAGAIHFTASSSTGWLVYTHKYFFYNLESHVIEHLYGVVVDLEGLSISIKAAAQCMS